MADRSQQGSWLGKAALAASLGLLISALLWAIIWPSFLRHWPWPLALLTPSVLSLCLALLGTYRRWPPQHIWPLVFVAALALTALTLALGTYLSRQLPWATALSTLILLVLPLILVIQYLKGTQWVSVLFVLLALSLYAGSLAYRAGDPARDVRPLTWTTPQVLDPTTNLSLAIAYPHTLLLESSDQADWPLSLHVWPPSISLTPTTPYTIVPGPISTLTPTLRSELSLTVAFVPPPEGLVLTNKEGVPVAPNVEIGLPQTSQEPSVLYLHRTSAESVSEAMSIGGQVFGPNGRPLADIHIEIQLEDTYSAWWRHLWGIVLGPTTPLLALAAAVVGFGWQWWQEGQRRRQTALEELKEVEVLANRDEAGSGQEKLDEVSAKYSREPRLRDDFRKAQLAVFRARIRRLGTWASTGPKEAVLREEESLRKEIVDKAPRDADSLLEELNETKLESEKRALSPWPKLWLCEKRPVEPAIDQWREQIGLTLNPFGPERAEDDPCLLQVIMDPPGWDVIKAPQPTVTFGSSGSGRTASRLYLTHTCRTKRLGRNPTHGRPFDTFPVLVFVFAEGGPGEASTACWRMLTRAVARSTLDFLARNPRDFSETPAEQQRALARLFNMHRHSLGDLACYLERSGLQRSIVLRLADNIRQASRSTRPPALTDEPEVLRLLANARLLPFQQSYIIVEIPDRVLAHARPEEIALHLTPLVQIMPFLAAREVYLKLFVTADVRNCLGTLPPSVSETELSWDETALHQMLERRVRQAGAPSFRALFGRVPRGADPATRLVQATLASEASPRRLIHLGQEVLVERSHRSSDDPRLVWDDLDVVLERTAKGEKP